MKPGDLPIRKCDCGYATMLDRPYCPKCHDLLHSGSTSPRGVVLSWTVVHITADGAATPAGLAMVGLESGINVMVKFQPSDPLAIGQRVTVVIDEAGLRWAQKDPAATPSRSAS